MCMLKRLPVNTEIGLSGNPRNTIKRLGLVQKATKAKQTVTVPLRFETCTSHQAGSSVHTRNGIERFVKRYKATEAPHMLTVPLRSQWQPSTKKGMGGKPRDGIELFGPPHKESKAKLMLTVPLRFAWRLDNSRISYICSSREEAFWQTRVCDHASGNL